IRLIGLRAPWLPKREDARIAFDDGAPDPLIDGAVEIVARRRGVHRQRLHLGYVEQVVADEVERQGVWLWRQRMESGRQTFQLLRDPMIEIFVDEEEHGGRSRLRGDIHRDAILALAVGAGADLIVRRADRTG